MGRIGANISGIELKLLNRLAQADAAATLNSLRLASGKKIGSPRDNLAFRNQHRAFDIADFALVRLAYIDD